MKDFTHTERLEIKATEPMRIGNQKRLLFVGFPKKAAGEPCMLPIVTVLLSSLRDPTKMLDWVETSSEHRRRGYAREMLEAIGKEHRLLVTPATENGNEFITRFRQDNKQHEYLQVDDIFS